ncbi:MAG: hypothetical protein R3C05_03130 [Pirellulaceae bacterium]
MKTQPIQIGSIAILASLFVVGNVRTPVSAGWFDRLVKPVAFEEIPVPDAINPPVQDQPSVLIDPTPVPYSEAYPAYPSYEAHTPVHPPAPLYQPAHPMHHAPAMCCKQPHVSYRNHPILAMLMHKCKTGHATQVVIEVPTGCCPAEVTVCVPLSCVACPPRVSKTMDLLGRCVFQYCWPCGTKINVVQRHTGDLIVHSYEL